MLTPLRVLLVALACVLALSGATPLAAAHASRPELGAAETVDPTRALFASDLRPAGTWMVTARTRVRHGAGRRPLDAVVPPRPRGARELREGVERITHLALAAAGAARVPQPRGPPAPQGL